jgi:hypothetical protein
MPIYYNATNMGAFANAKYHIYGMDIDVSRLFAYNISDCESKYPYLYGPTIGSTIVCFLRYPNQYIYQLPTSNPLYKDVVLWAIRKVYHIKE